METLRTLEALAKNELADESVLYVFSDGPKEKASEKDLQSIHEVRRLVNCCEWFKEVILFESEKNNGLANSIIKGVTEIVNKHGKVIVLEDDIVTSRYFLKFLNDGLDVYEATSQVYAINSYMFPIQTERIDTFLSPLATTSWGWATWKEKWGAFQRETPYKWLIQSNRFLRARFNLADSDLTYMLDNTNSWAIRWYYSVFIRNGLGLFPTKSLSKHIGFGEVATHTKTEFDQMEIYQEAIEIVNQNQIDFELHEKVLDYFTKTPKKLKLRQRISNKFKSILRFMNHD